MTSRHVLVGASIGCAFATGSLARVAFDASRTPAKPRPAACQEDAPCWNWRTMGNGRRGVVLATRDHRRVVVDASAFDTLARVGAIDWRATPHLRGDTP